MKSANVSLKKNAIGAILLLFAGIAFTGCKKDDSSPVPSVGSGLMAFNLAPDNDHLGVALSGNRLNNAPLAYTNFTGAYLSIYPGERSIESYDFVTDSLLASSSFSFDNNKYYSLFVIGYNGVYKNLVVKDDLDSLSASSGQAYVRYINAIPDSATPAISITSGGNDVVSDHSGFGTVSNFTAIIPGSISIDVNDEHSIAANRTITLDAGKAYTALLIGVPSATDSTRRVQIKYVENGTLTD